MNTTMKRMVAILSIILAIYGVATAKPANNNSTITSMFDKNKEVTLSDDYFFKG